MTQVKKRIPSAKRAKHVLLTFKEESLSKEEKPELQNHGRTPSPAQFFKAYICSYHLVNLAWRFLRLNHFELNLSGGLLGVLKVFHQSWVTGSTTMIWGNSSTMIWCSTMIWENGSTMIWEKVALSHLRMLSPAALSLCKRSSSSPWFLRLCWYSLLNFLLPYHLQ